ncbi:MAG: WD40 repeat domain-containing protein [Treponema sp.]|nr:WD40 repeat domain-containing protein [Treponema sp.]
MKTKRHIGVFVLIAFLFIVLYICLAARPLGKEYHFTPEWKKSITLPPVQKDFKDSKPVFFKLGQSIGYFTPEGDITTSKTFPFRASISSDYYAVYNSEDKNIAFFDYKNQEKGALAISGYPFFEEDRIFVFMPGGASFARCADDGSVMWIYENIVPITAFSSKENFTAAGYADGTIKIFANESGTELSGFAPGGSDYNVILGLDVSSDGKYIASVSGQNRQRFVISKLDGSQTKIIHHDYLDSSLNRRTVVKFCDNDRQVIYNYDGYMGIYNITENKGTQIKIDCTITAVEETDSLFFVLGKKDKEYTVFIIEKTQTLDGSFTFTADSAFIKTSENDLYIGQDTTISKMKVSKE